MAEEILTGTIESVVYHNDDTGYTVCSVFQNGHKGEPPVTLVGNSVAVWAGEEIHAKGEWTRHKQHGRQFQAAEMTCITPTSLEGIRRFLASGMIRGIGKTTAEKIVRHFGEDTLRVLDKESARLEEIEGIGAGKRRMIKESWSEQFEIRSIMIFLQSHGIGTGQAARIYRQYGTDSIAVVKRNPYRLCADVWGIGFKSADKIALDVGIEKNSEIRASAGLRYVMALQEDEGGHCFTQESELLLSAEELLDIPVETLARVMEIEVDEGRIIRDDGRVYLRDVYYAEKNIAEMLHRISVKPVPYDPIPAEKAVGWAESQMGVHLAPEQHRALITSLESKVSIITGGPGVGKTTIVRALTEIFRARRLMVRLAAPTGRAAKRMNESTGQEATTLHRLLKYLPNERKFEYNRFNRLQGDCFILDETSMVDVRLMSQVIEALPDSSVLILVGDTDQLPSVGPGNVLRDLIDSTIIPCCRLTTIFRQDKGGLIVRNAHHINHGELFETAEGDSDFYFINTEEPEKIIERVKDLMLNRIPHKFGFDPLRDIQVLTPMRRGLLGAENLNDVIQAMINPGGVGLVRGAVNYRKGDRVMQIRNNSEKDVYNGDIGIIVEVDELDRCLSVMFDSVPVSYRQDELDELALAYACSIHKSQGSEYTAAIILLHTQHYKLLQRNLLYTAVTRGRKLVIVVGSERAVSIALNNNTIRARRTTLRQRLVETSGATAD